MSVYASNRAEATPRVAEPSLQSDPVETFAKLVETRRRSDHRAAAPLLKTLRRMGWQVVAVEPKPAEVRR